MKVIVLGGDGFCGWPCAVNLAEQNHEVIIVDNLSRRKIDIDLEVESLTPISSINERLSAWEETGGKPIKFVKKGRQETKNLVALEKRIPNLRVIQKYAVKLGGGTNHRFNLSDEFLIKDNHLASSNKFEEIVKKAIKYKKKEKLLSR